MKKVLSLLLAVMLVVGLAPAVFAAAPGDLAIGSSPDTTKIITSGGIVDTSANGNVGMKEKLYLFYFDENSNQFEVMDRQYARDNKVDVRVSAKEGKSVLKSVTLKYEDNGTGANKRKVAYVEVAFVDPFVSTKEVDYDFEIQLWANKSKAGDVFTVSGTYKNELEEVYGDDDYVNLSGDKGGVAECKEYARNIEVELPESVFIYTNMFKDKKYYGYVSQDIKDEDQDIMDKYPDITSIYYLSTLGLNATSNKVKIDLDDEKLFVYDADLQYLGTTDEMLPYSNKYYVASKELDIDDVDIDEAPDDDDDDDDFEPGADLGGDDVPENINDNPGTGR